MDQLPEERFMPLRSEIGQILSTIRKIQTAFTFADRGAGDAGGEAHPVCAAGMQEVIGEMPILRQHMHARFGEDKYHRDADNGEALAGRGQTNPALSPELLFTAPISLGSGASPACVATHALTFRQYPTDHCQPRADADPPGIAG